MSLPVCHKCGNPHELLDQRYCIRCGIKQDAPGSAPAEASENFRTPGPWEYDEPNACVIARGGDGYEITLAVLSEDTDRLTANANGRLMAQAPALRERLASTGDPSRFAAALAGLRRSADEKGRVTSFSLDEIEFEGRLLTARLERLTAATEAALDWIKQAVRLFPVTLNAEATCDLLRAALETEEPR